MLGDPINIYSNCGQLGMTVLSDPLQLMNSRPGLYAGLQAQAQGISNDRAGRSLRKEAPMDQKGQWARVHSRTLL